MVKNIIARVVLIVLVAIFFVSSSSVLMKKIAAWRYATTTMWGSDKYRYGDLFGFSYLKEFKIPMEQDTAIVKPADCKKPRNINIYAIGDSYIFNYLKDDSVFCATRHVYLARWSNKDMVDNIEKLDKTKRNIVLICCNERQVFVDLVDTTQIYQHINYTNGKKVTPPNNRQSMWELAFNPIINQNLEFNIFDYTFITPFKELKAAINYHIFGRTDKDVVVANNGHNLVMKETITPTLKTSYQYKFDTAQITAIVNSMNKVYAHYKNLGFDDVVLSISPSPIGIINGNDPKYNNVINVILNDPRIKVTRINADPDFKNGAQYFLRSDSHWNKSGYRLWVNRVNDYLKTL